MEDCNNENSKKRAREESDLESPESKRIREDSVSNSSGSDPVESEKPEVNAPGNFTRDDILDMLDDSDSVTDRDPSIQDLDFVIKSFEEEILHQPPPPISDCGESQPELGYLLEASDDELGLPPASSPSDRELQPQDDSTTNMPTIPSVANELGDILRFEDEIPSYNSFEYGLGGENEAEGNGDFVTLGGLFDYSEQSDFSEFMWHPESLPAL